MCIDETFDMFMHQIKQAGYLFGLGAYIYICASHSKREMLHLCVLYIATVNYYHHYVMLPTTTTLNNGNVTTTTDTTTNTKKDKNTNDDDDVFNNDNNDE